MSTKRFCDYCGCEIRSDRSHGGTYRNETTLRRCGVGGRDKVTVTITVEVEAADICSSCVFGAVEQIDPRDKGADEVSS